MPEAIMAKLLVEVQWGLIPGKPDGQKQWGFSREQVEAALDAAVESDPEADLIHAVAWHELLKAAYEEYDKRLNPAYHNWVTMTWLWL